MARMKKDGNDISIYVSSVGNKEKQIYTTNAAKEGLRAVECIEIHQFASRQPDGAKCAIVSRGVDAYNQDQRQVVRSHDSVLSVIAQFKDAGIPEPKMTKDDPSLTQRASAAVSKAAKKVSHAFHHT